MSETKLLSTPTQSKLASSRYIPRLVSRVEEGGILTFTMDNINVSLANALRRIILSEIPTLVFRTFPYSENKASISVNTSRLHNEIMKQRLSAIPIHISDPEFPYKDYMLEVDVVNDTQNIRYITTADFKIKNKQNDKYLTEAKVREIFPPDPTTGDYIEFGRLMPKMTEYGEGERLALTCDFDIGRAKEDGAYNVVSTCSYSMTMDPSKIQDAWKLKEAELVKDGIDLDSDEMKDQKKNWLLLDGQRCTKENSFDFVIETIGVYSNVELVEMAAKAMIDKCKKFISDIEGGENRVQPSASTLEHGFDIELKGEDYTLGKALEFFIYDKHYIEDQSVSYCSFRKVHPHSIDSLIRIGFAEAVDEAIASKYIIQAAHDVIGVFENIRDHFQ